MHIIREGKDRIVLAFPKLGFVLKFARIDYYRIKRAIRYTKQFFSEVSGDSLSGEIVKLGKRIEMFSLGGIYANLRERCVWKNTKNPFLLPTWFTFFGLVNICPYAKNILNREHYNLSKLPLQMGLYSELWYEEAGHTFGRACNFCIDDSGKVKLVDYGFEHSEGIIRRCGQRLYDNLNPFKTFTQTEVDSMISEISASWKVWKLEKARVAKFNLW